MNATIESELRREIGRLTNMCADMGKANAKLRDEREWLLFLVNSMRLPMGIDPAISNFDRERILPRMQAGAMARGREIEAAKRWAKRAHARQTISESQ